MARTVIVDCVLRDPDTSVEAVLQEVRHARPGATILHVRADSGRVISFLRDWAGAHGVAGSVVSRAGIWEARLYLIPDQFGELPRVTREERRRGMIRLGNERRQHAEAAVIPA